MAALPPSQQSDAAMQPAAIASAPLQHPDTRRLDCWAATGPDDGPLNTTSISSDQAIASQHNNHHHHHHYHHHKHGQPQGVPILQDVCYKGTKLGTGLVVKRRVALYENKIITFHDPDGPQPKAADNPRTSLQATSADGSNPPPTSAAFCAPSASSSSTHKSWHLHRHCVLRPHTTAELLAAPPRHRGVRPRGTWAIKAALQGVEASVQLVRA